MHEVFGFISTVQYSILYCTTSPRALLTILCTYVRARSAAKKIYGCVHRAQSTCTCTTTVATKYSPLSILECNDAHCVL